MHCRLKVMSWSWAHLVKRSGCAKNSATISNKERLSSIKAGKEIRVRSMPSLSWDRMWKITDLCVRMEPEGVGGLCPSKMIYTKNIIHELL